MYNIGVIRNSAHLTEQVLMPAPSILQRCLLNPRSCARTETGDANTAGAAEWLRSCALMGSEKPVIRTNRNSSDRRPARNGVVNTILV